jgi:outer membrane protein assembly factor BamB
MSHPLALALALLLAFSGSPATAAGSDPAEQWWPQWRGPLATGVAPRATPPLEWSETKNIRWKIPLPGLGHSTPVAWGDRLFVTAAIPQGDAIAPPSGPRPGEHDNLATVHRQKFVVMAIGRRDGKIVWQRTVAEGVPHEVHHQTASDASSSPVTDGRHVWAFFGSRGLHCLDTDGNPKWNLALGTMQTLHGHGEGSSPALHGDTLVINWDHEGADFVVALDKHTGKVLWKAPRDEVTSWSTPIVVTHGGKAQVIVAATSRIRAYDLATGAVLWECGGLSQNVVASPVAGQGMVFAGSSYELKAVLGIRLEGARGNITGSDRVAWTLRRDSPYVPSPLLYDGKLYFLRHYQNVITCLDAATGTPLYSATRLPGHHDVYASLAGAAGRVYVISREGTTFVLAHGPAYALLATNDLDDQFSASPVLVEGELYLRGERHLYCIAEPAAAPASPAAPGTPPPRVPAPMFTP